MLKLASRLGAVSLLLASTASQAALFTVTWSGAQYQNSATATGVFDFAATPADLGGDQPLRSFPDPQVSLVSFAITDNGSTTNFTQADFSNFYFASYSQLDYSKELIGQGMTNGCAFGSFDPACYGGPSGDFNLFGSHEGLPFGSFFFQLTDASGNDLAVTSIAPTVSGVPEPAAWAMMIVGFMAVGAAMRRRSRTRTAVSFA